MCRSGVDLAGEAAAGGWELDFRDELRSSTHGGCHRRGPASLPRRGIHAQKLAESFDLNITTDFGQIEQVIQARIDRNRGKVRVATDLSSEGLADIEAEERMQKAMAEEALTQFEVELGLRSPEATKLPEAQKDLGPALTEKTAETQSGG